MPGISFVSNAFSGASSGSSVTISKPSGLLTGDLLIAVVGASAGALVTTFPTGWTVVKSTNNGTSAGNIGQTVLTKTATGSEPASYTFGLNASAGAAQGDIAVYRGALSVNASAQAVTSTSPATAPAVTTTAAGCLICALFTEGNGQTWTINSPLTSRFSDTAGVRRSALGDWQQANAGSSGTFTATSATTPAIATTLALLPSNSAPNAPTLTSPANNATVDRTATQRLAWTFSDPDAGDSQSAFDLQYRVGAGAWTTISQTTPNAFYDAAAGTFTNGSTYEWQVRTYDAQGLVGPWSSSSFFTAATTPTVTITAPTSGGTVSNTGTVTWSTPSQTDYQVRRVADNAGSADTGTVYSDTGDVIDTTTRSISVAFPTNNRYEHIQVRVKASGLWSSWADVRVQVSYTPPRTPTLVLTPDLVHGSLTVAITNPTPGTGVPAVAYNDIYLDDGNGEERRATGLAANASWTYYTPISVRDYTGNVRVVAVATNGTSASSS